MALNTPSTLSGIIGQDFAGPGVNAANQASSDAIDQGLNNPESVGGIPNYVVLSQSIQALQKQQVSLPIDMQIAINNAAQAQLGANQAVQMLQGGDVARAARSLSGDAMANAALKPGANAFDKSVEQNVGSEQNMDRQEASQAGHNALGNAGSVDLSRLRDLAMQAQAHHSNMALGTQTAGMQENLQNQQAQGVQTAQTAAQGAQQALASANIAGDVAAWGNAMTGLRAGLSAGSAAASAGTQASAAADAADAKDEGLTYNDTPVTWASGGVSGTDDGENEGDK